MNRGKAKEVSYRPLNKAIDTKQVVWQPCSKRTGQPRPYWLHRAVNLRFHRVSLLQWFLSIRPEFRVTKDGINLEAAEKIGSRITRKKQQARPRRSHAICGCSAGKAGWSERWWYKRKHRAPATPSAHLRRLLQHPSLRAVTQVYVAASLSLPRPCAAAAYD